MNVLEALEKRRSVRWYEDRPVEQEKLDQIVKFGNKAPISGEIHLTVIRNPQLLKKINDTVADMMRNSDNEFMKSRIALPGYEPLYDAPVLIVVSGPEGARGNGANGACSAMNMITAATGLGLGSCYVMSPTMVIGRETFRKQAGLPDGFEPIVGVLIGYKAGDRFGRDRGELNNINYVD
ncbi:nitroreductase family protein [Alkalibacter rhizosphaerae]|uniref:Nitroreductase family protein n=1 Tax=Alkalibacter rhizosphaerae TaxID=2815577 RepID=A0A974XI75_9FIRM|nr:nitroreductase family protein [Alkalibacter rhizosphaerae]QSX09155.1 nitroreductase family protein [Alkalibacter rhizosphaerae]